MSHEIVTASGREWVDQAGALAMDTMRTVVERTGRCRVALSGGSTPGRVFSWFAERLPPELEAKLWVTWADERVLPRVGSEPGWHGLDARVSAKQAFELWLDGSRIPPEQILMLSERGELEEELSEVRRRFAQEFSGGIDVALLGAGGDGHIASLFPGRGWEGEGGVIIVRESPKPPPVRVSLTMSVLSEAIRFVWAKGEGKAGAFEAANRGGSGTPLEAVTRAPGRCVWVLDEEAARGV